MRIFTKSYWVEVFSLEMILKTTIQTIVGTIMVGSFFMLATDFIVKPIDLSGRWALTLKPASALGKMNRCVDIGYTVLFSQNDLDVIAIGEKRSDRLSANEGCKVDMLNKAVARDYKPGKGSKMNLSGYVNKGYIKSDVLTLSIYEGKNKDRFTVGQLEVIDENLLQGFYDSNISNTKGIILLKREKG